MLFKWIFSAVLSSLGTILTPIFDFLNKRVDANARIHIGDVKTLGAVVGVVEGGIQNADGLNTQVRLKEGAWSPWVVCTIGGFMLPCAFHFWQIVIDSSKWLIVFGPWYVPHVVQVRDKVAALPGGWETLEQAIIQSLFVGAGVAVGAIPVIAAGAKALKTLR